MKIGCVLSLVVLLCLMIPLSSAEIVNILLKSPAGGTTTASNSPDFIFSFDKYSTIENCSLIVDGNFKALRNTMIGIENNKMTATLEAGEHTWQIICYDNDNNKIASEERTLKITAGGIIKTGYETIYNSNGLRSYLIQIAEGKAPVELPAMKLSEDIRIKAPQKTHYIDVLRMGSESGTFFVEVRDRSNSKIHRLLVGKSIQLDLDNDKTTDIELNLKNVERSVNAYFIVTSYPDSQVAPETQPTKEPSEEPKTDNKTPETGAESSVKPESPVAEEKGTIEAENKPVEEEVITEQSKMPKTTIFLIAAVIILILISALVVIIKNSTNKVSKGKKDKSAHKARSENTPKSRVIEIKKEPIEELSDEPIRNDKDENFEVITSVGKKRR